MNSAVSELPTNPEPQKVNGQPPVAVIPTNALLMTGNLVKEYHSRRVVNGVTIGVAAGEIVGLLGPNGAGKTTTFNMVVGVVRPDDGYVSFRDRDIHQQHGVAENGGSARLF